MRKRTAGGKSTTRWRLSFWCFSIGFRIITALFHRKNRKKPVVQWTTGFFNEINPVGFVKCASRVKYGFAK